MNFLNVACSLAHASLSLSLSVHSSWPSLALPVVVPQCGKCEDTSSPRAPGESQAVERDSLLCSPFTSPFLSPIIPSFLPFCPSFLSVFLPCIFHHILFSSFLPFFLIHFLMLTSPLFPALRIFLKHDEVKPLLFCPLYSFSDSVEFEFICEL